MRLFRTGLFAVLLAGSLPAWSGLSESGALEAGMNREQIQTLLNSRRKEARGRRRSAGRWSNPELEYSRESLDLPGGDSDETIWQLRQRIDLAGVQRLEGKAADKAFDADEHRLEKQRRHWRARIRERFYRVLAAQQRLEALRRYRDRLDELARVIRKRLAQGEASRYDRLRIDQERTLINGDFREARAGLESERARLFTLLDTRAGPVTGELLPPGPGTGTPETVLADHPSLQALAAARDSASLEASAARRRGWPRLTLGLGRKALAEPGLDADGGVVSVGVELPLFDRGSGEADAARARAAGRRADLALTRERLHGELASARAELKAQRTSARELQASMNRDGKSLTEIAEAAYGGGAINIMELIDAYRTELDTWRTFIDRALDARKWTRTPRQSSPPKSMSP